MEISYKVRFPTNLSATAISSFSDCEQSFFYTWPALDVQSAPDHISLVYGSAIHQMAYHIWKQKLSGKKFTHNIVRFCHQFVADTLNGKHGPRSVSDPPVPIRWLSLPEEERLTEEEQKEIIFRKKGEYIGKAYFALRAIYLECAEPNPFVRTELEYSFRKNDVTLPVLPGGLGFPLYGVMDRVHFLPDGNYIIIDYKTGASAFYLRNKIVRDIQMTIYQYAGELIWGKPPIAIFIQPLEVTERDIKTYGAKTLEHLRIEIPVRKDPVHNEQVIGIARDIVSVLGFLLKPGKHSAIERKEWHPTSEWGKMAAFADNVLQNRFIPRVGRWCGMCKFNRICRADNAVDWKRWEEFGGNSAFGENSEDVKEVQNIREEELPAQGSLFPMKMRPRSYSKSDREIRKEMISSGNFFRAINITARLKEMHRILMNGSDPCPCVRLGFLPIHFLTLLPQFLEDRGKKWKDRKITAHELRGACRYKNCPHQKETV